MTDFFSGDIYLQQNNQAAAQVYLSQALAIQPSLPDVQLDMAKMYHSQGKVEDAVKMLQAVVASAPEQQEAHYLLFGIYKEQGQTESARKELQTFEALKRKAADQERRPARLDSLN